ncbi:uracil phosphoribosyltransferase [Candidatus Dependentiae bacterium]
MKKVTITLTALAACFFSNSYNRSHIIENKFADSLLTILRDKTTDCTNFQETTKKLSNYLAFETAQFLDFDNNPVQTPCGPFNQGIKLHKNPILISVYRAGLSLLDTFRTYFKGAPCGFFGIKRNEETAEAQMYYRNIPEIKEDDKIIILETMLATGGSLSMVISELKKAGAKEENIIVASVIAATQGIQALEIKYPNITIITVALDNELNEKKYIVPGLGDFGDRFFGNDAEQNFEKIS